MIQTRVFLGSGPAALLPGRVMARLLVVEDDAAIGDPLVRALEREGHEVAHAVTGEEALAQLDAADVDLVVLDIGLPGIDGIEVCRRLRVPRTRGRRVLMLTARSSELDEVSGWTPARTTTSPSRSRCPPWPRACGRCCAAATPRVRTWRRPRRRTSASTRPRAARGAATANSNSRRRSSTCSRLLVERAGAAVRRDDASWTRSGTRTGGDRRDARRHVGCPAQARRAADHRRPPAASASASRRVSLRRRLLVSTARSPSPRCSSWATARVVGTRLLRQPTRAAARARGRRLAVRIGRAGRRPPARRRAARSTRSPPPATASSPPAGGRRIAAARRSGASAARRGAPARCRQRDRARRRCPTATRRRRRLARGDRPLAGRGRGGGRTRAAAGRRLAGPLERLAGRVARGPAVRRP